MEDGDWSFVDPVPEELRCPLHLGVLRDPVVVSCGHSFCKECISFNPDGTVCSRKGISTASIAQAVPMAPASAPAAARPTIGGSRAQASKRLKRSISASAKSAHSLASGSASTLFDQRSSVTAGGGGKDGIALDSLPPGEGKAPESLEESPSEAAVAITPLEGFTLKALIPPNAPAGAALVGLDDSGVVDLRKSASPRKQEDILEESSGSEEMVDEDFSSSDEEETTATKVEVTTNAVVSKRKVAWGAVTAERNDSFTATVIRWSSGSIAGEVESAAMKCPGRQGDPRQRLPKYPCRLHHFTAQSILPI